MTCQDILVSRQCRIGQAKLPQRRAGEGAGGGQQSSRAPREQRSPTGRECTGNLPASKQKPTSDHEREGRRRKRMLEGEDTAIEEFHRSTPKKLQM
ncbi:hypothetical protein R1flu_021148 [Riccia fluitans]|uniref:Uncharacterized protein n=1 Tax=Riccia fluitans TaxID=41844 RepID=A0ABD1ZNV6_9MARC